MGGNLRTHTFPNIAKAQANYKLINKKWINSALKCETYSSFEGVSSAHWIFTEKMHLNLCRNKKQTVQTTHYNRSSLTNKDIWNKCTVTTKNKFDSLREISETHTPNDNDENFLFAYIGVAAECIPTKPRTNDRVSLDSLVVMKQRDHMKIASSRLILN